MNLQAHSLEDISGSKANAKVWPLYRDEKILCLSLCANPSSSAFDYLPTLAKFYQIPPDLLGKPQILKQIHSSEYHNFSPSNTALLGPAELSGDAWAIKRIDELSKQCCAIYTADCWPVFALDRQNSKAALLHLGRKGIAQRLLPKTISALCSRLGVAQNWQLFSGPAVQSCCYQVEDELAAEFLLEAGVSGNCAVEDKSQKGYRFLDLRMAIFEQALQLSIARENIQLAENCSSCLAKQELSSGQVSRSVYSYRQEHSKDRIYTLLFFL